MNAAETRTSGGRRGLAAMLVRRAVRNMSFESHDAKRLRLGLVQGWCAVVANGVIFAAKLALGIYLSSISLIADSVDSVFDVLGGAIIIASAHWSRRPRDVEHPYGHGRIDLVASLVMAVLLIVAGIELARASVMRILNPESYCPPWWLIGVVAATIPVKEWLTSLSRIVSEETDAATATAGYWYQRFDSLTTSVVCLGLVASRFGWPAADGWIGLAIAIWIARTGVKLAQDAISPLLGEAPTMQEVNAVMQAAASQEGVRGVHGVLMHKYGDTRVVSLHIEVDAAKTAGELHDVAERVEAEVEEQTKCRAIVHVDPIDHTHPLYERVREEVARSVAQDARVLGFHDLRVSGSGENLNISMDLVIALNLDKAAEAEIRKGVVDFLRTVFPQAAEIKITLEGSFASSGGT
jgi:cation diffusion facilitator family transporter